MSLPKVTQKIRKKAQYLEGTEAFSDGVCVDDSPYKSCGMHNAPAEEGEKRMTWMAGWYDAKYKEQFPKLFDKSHPDYVSDKAVV